MPQPIFQGTGPLNIEFTDIAGARLADGNFPQKEKTITIPQSAEVEITRTGTVMVKHNGKRFHWGINSIKQIKAPNGELVGPWRP